MVSIPAIEPKALIAGDTWQWTRSLSDYPATTWTLTYYVRDPKDAAKVRTIQASASADDFAITVAASVTKDYPPGIHPWIARVSASGVVHTIERGEFAVTADFSQPNVDHRTWAQRCLDNIEAVIEGNASTDQLSFAIEDMSLSRMSWTELLSKRRYFRDRVAREQGIKTGSVKVRL